MTAIAKPEPSFIDELIASGEKLYDRSEVKWPEGPWNEEPDLIVFEFNGIPCVLRRNNVGAWCVYAAAEEGYPLYETEGRELEMSITANFTSPVKREELERYWWFGMDFCHADDLIPGLMSSPLLLELLKKHGSTYKDVRYAIAECTELAQRILNTRRSLNAQNDS